MFGGAIDSALAFATTSSHVGDIYDTNPTCWAIWLVQRAHTLKAGAWTAETVEVQQRLGFRSGTRRESSYGRCRRAVRGGNLQQSLCDRC